MFIAQKDLYFKRGYGSYFQVFEGMPYEREIRPVQYDFKEYHYN